MPKSEAKPIDDESLQKKLRDSVRSKLRIYRVGSEEYVGMPIYLLNIILDGGCGLSTLAKVLEESSKVNSDKKGKVEK